MIHTVKGFGIVNKAEIDVFLELSCFFNDPADVGNLISGYSAFSKTRLNIWKLTVHVLLKLGLENFEHYFASMWNECNCAVVWAFFGIAFLWDWNENWPFPVLWPLLSCMYEYICVIKQILKNIYLPTSSQPHRVLGVNPSGREGCGWEKVMETKNMQSCGLEIVNVGGLFTLWRKNLRGAFSLSTKNSCFIFCHSDISHSH